MRIIIAFIVLLLAFPAQAQTFGAQEFTLKNGMQVVVIPNHRSPVITHMIWYKVGAAEETPGKSGMAHYLEHLLFKGTAKMGPGEYSKTIKILGGNDNAFTAQDYTAFHETVSVDHLQQVMEMEADRMLNVNPPPEHYKSEKAVIIEERRQRTDNNPTALFAEQMNSVLYINHPYSIPVIGWMNEMKLYEWPDVKAFYDKWYAPNNAILVVSGDITADQLKPLAEKIYGVLPTKTIEPRHRPLVAPGNSQTLVSLQDPSVHQPMWDKMYLATCESRDMNDALALEVLAEIMDGGPTTRLYKNLVVTQKKATGVEFNYNSTALDYGSITLSATPADGVSLDDLGKAIMVEVNDVIKNGVTPAETKDAIQRLQDEAVYARDSLTGPAMIFGAALATGSTVADVENWPANIAKVTPAQIQAAAAKYLNDVKPWIRPAVTGNLIPGQAAPASEEKPKAAPQAKKEPSHAR